MILWHGEMLIDFIPTEGARRYACLPAGGWRSPGNVGPDDARSACLAGFVGGLSRDFFGEQIDRHADREQRLHGLRFEARPPDNARHSSIQGEEPRYAFYDYESAPRNWRWKTCRRSHRASMHCISDRFADPLAGRPCLRPS